MSRKTSPAAKMKGDSTDRRLPARLALHFRNLAFAAAQKRESGLTLVVRYIVNGRERVRLTSGERKNSRGLQVGTCRYDRDSALHRRRVSAAKARRRQARRTPAAPVSELLTAAPAPQAAPRRRMLRRIIDRVGEFLSGAPVPETAP